MCRRRSILTNMYFNKETGVITFRGCSAGYKRNESKIYINIPPDFGQFEVDTNFENLRKRSKILAEPPKQLADKFIRLSLKDEIISLKDENLVPRKMEFGAYIALKGVDLSSPYGPLEGHLFMIQKNTYDGMIELARNSQEFRESKFGAAFLKK